MTEKSYPDEAVTRVGRVRGAVVMNIPFNDQTHVPAIQSAGRAYKGKDYTCEGFRFKEDPAVIYPNAYGWIGLTQGDHVVSMIKRSILNKPVTAESAVWRAW